MFHHHPRPSPHRAHQLLAARIAQLSSPTQPNASTVGLPDDMNPPSLASLNAPPIKLIKGLPGSGKTHELMEMSHKTQSVIVCRDEKTAETLYRYSIKRGKQIPHPITYVQYARGKHDPISSGVLIDDWHDFIHMILPHAEPVRAITFCEHPELASPMIKLRRENGKTSSTSIP